MSEFVYKQDFLYCGICLRLYFCGDASGELLYKRKVSFSFKQKLENYSISSNICIKGEESHLIHFYGVSPKSVVATWWSSLHFNGAATNLQQQTLKLLFLREMLQGREEI